MAERDTQRKFNERAAELEPAAGQAFVDSWQAYVNGVSLEGLQRAIFSGGSDGAARFLRTTPETIDQFGTEIQTAFVAGGAIAFATIPVKQNTPDGVRVSRVFAGTRPEDATAVTAQIDRVVRELAPSTASVVQNTLNDGLRRIISVDERMEELVGKLNPATGNREGGTLGLNQRDARTLQSVDDGFRTGNTARINSYFELDGRNKSLDGRIKRAIAKDGRISDTLRLEVRRAMQARLLAKRGLVFARAEVYNGIQAGRITGYNRIVAMGIVEDDSLRRVWETFIDSSTRPSHVSIDGQVRTGDEPFMFPDGTRMSQPRDGSFGAPLREIVNCRCYVRFDFKFRKF